MAYYIISISLWQQMKGNINSNESNKIKEKTTIVKYKSEILMNTFLEQLLKLHWILFIISYTF